MAKRSVSDFILLNLGMRQQLAFCFLIFTTVVYSRARYGHNPHASGAEISKHFLPWHRFAPQRTELTIPHTNHYTIYHSPLQ